MIGDIVSMTMKYFALGRLALSILSMSLCLTACAVARGRHGGIITVSNISELTNAISTAINSDTIVVSTNGSPYNFDQIQSMSRVGHIYIDKTISIIGQSGNAEDVVFSGSNNRIIYVNAPGCRIEGVTFQYGDCSSNIATNQAPRETCYGGAIFLAQSENECIVSNCIFRWNNALRGGAISSLKTGDISSKVYGCVFDSNTASVHGGASYAVYNLSNCQFNGNSSENSGGAVAYASNVVGCAFIGNTSGKGGASSFSVLNDCAFTNNCGTYTELYNCTATNIEIESSAPDTRLFNVRLNRGRIKATMGGVIFSGECDVRNTLVADGFQFSLCKSMRSNPQFINCTIVNNRDYRLRQNTKTESNVDFRNCLFFNNTYPERIISEDEVDAGDYDVDSYALTTSYFESCIFKLYYDPGSDELNTFNCFYNYMKESMEFIGVGTMPMNPYAITGSSPACHRNFSSYYMEQITVQEWMYDDVDLLGNPRLQGGGLDIGCYQAISSP